MKIIESIKLAIRALAANKLRSTLTMLGVVIGVAVVVALIAIGDGAKSAVTGSIQSLGSNLIIVIPGNPQARERGGLMTSDQTVLKLRDVEAIRQQAKYVEAVTPILTRTVTISYKGKSKITNAYGTYENATKIMNFPLKKGRDFSKAEVVSAARVVVIGARLEKDLFGAEDPLGKIVKINNQNFKVIGVLKERGANMFGVDMDDQVGIPVTTAQQKLFGIDYVNIIEAKAKDEASLEPAMREITRILRRTHNIRNNEDDFTVRSQTQLLDIMANVTSILTVVLASLAGISLIVGGIGIMNIMLVSVTERTKEIGIRKAVGAKRRDILMQFLVEAVVISLTGGIIGIGAGFAMSKSVTLVGNIPTHISPQAIVLAVGFSLCVGIFFGLYPAYRAAKLHPIQALRYE